MTAQESLNRRKRRMMGLIYSLVSLQMASVLIGELLNQRFLIFLTLPVFFVAFILMLYWQHRSFRCPWCRGNLSSLVYGRGVFSFDRRFQFCPYCAHRLDEELPEPELVSAGDYTRP